MTILYIVLAVVVGFLLGRASKKSVTTLPSTPEEMEAAHVAAREAVARRTEDRKEEILEMMRNNVERHEELKACSLETERKGIDRKDVEELLDVKEDAALKYINELEAEGKIRQIGLRGASVYYMLAE